MSEQQFRKHIRPYLTYLRHLGDIAVTQVFSAQADAEIYRARVKKQWCENLNVITDCSSGS